MHARLSVLAVMAATAAAVPNPSSLQARGCYGPDCSIPMPPPPTHFPCYECCLPMDVARELAQQWNNFWYSTDANIAIRVLDGNFKYYSDSDNMILPLFDASSMPQELGTPLFHNRDEFIAEMPSGEQEYENPTINVEVFNSCNKIGIRWIAPKGWPDIEGSCSPIRGMDMLDVSNTNGTWLITRAYTEYNNLIVVVDTDTCKYFCRHRRGRMGGYQDDGECERECHEQYDRSESESESGSDSDSDCNDDGCN